VSGRGFEPALASPASPGVILGLERAVYGDTEVADARFIAWLYARNPVGEGLVWYAATGDADAPSAGQVAVVPLRVEVRGAAATAGLVLNVVTHPRWRGRGVFAALLAHAVADNARRGFRYTFALPNPSSTPGFLRRAGFADAGRVPLLLAPLDPVRVAATRRGLVGLGAGVGARVLAAFGAAHRARAARLPVEEVPADWDGFDALWPRLRAARGVAVIRDRAFAAWRFGACPTRRYRVHVVRSGGDAAGVIVTRLAPVLGIPAGLVVDLALVPGPTAEAAGAALLAHACDELAAGGAALAASLMLPSSAEYRTLRAAGFVPCPRVLEPQPFRVVLRAHGAMPPTLEGWFLTMADYDVV
jgi:GNAT superfamily N-acetyltransferase